MNIKTDDNMMDTKQISEFFGVNFYKTFVTYSAKELMSKYKDMACEHDGFSIKTDTMRCRDDEENIFYVKVVDNKIVKYDYIAENCVMSNGRFYHVENFKIKEGAPLYIDGSFDCSNTKITSLEGAPQEVRGECYCYYGTYVPREQADEYKYFLIYPTPEHIDDTGHYKP